MADQDIILKIIAQDQYSAQLKDARAAVDKMTDAEKASALETAKVSKESNVLKGSMTELKAGFDVVSMAAGFAGKVYNALVGDTIEYAGTVKDLALNLSLTTEETSKLVSIGQKFGVSSQTLSSSLEVMVKRGIAPSLSGIADLSDKMMAIQDPVERAKQLSEMFGRSWTSLMPILEKGGAAIRAAGDEAEKFGRVLSDKDTKAVEDLEIKMNTLGMKVDGLKTKIGTALIPVLDDAATGATYFAQAISGANTISEQYERAITQLSFAFGADSDQVKQASEAYRNYLWTLQEAEQTTDAVDRATQRQAASTEALIPLTQQQTDGMKAYALAAQTGGQAQADFNKWLDTEQNSAANAALSMKELTTQTIYNTAAAGLSADAALDLGVKMGLIDKDAFGAAKAIQNMKDQLDAGLITNSGYSASIMAIQDAIAGLKDKNITVTVETIAKEMANSAATAARGLGSVYQGHGSDQGYATGTRYTIPPGYNENYPIRGMGSSGETVSVTPVNQQTNQVGSVVINIGSISKDYTPRQAGDAIVDRMRARGIVA